jgi:hypothetical protein
MDSGRRIWALSFRISGLALAGLVQSGQNLDFKELSAENRGKSGFSALVRSGKARERRFLWPVLCYVTHCVL